MKTVLTFAFIIIMIGTSFGQEKVPNEYKFDFPRRNSIYAESFIFFPAIYYDRLIPVSNDLGFHVGAGYALGFVLRGNVFFGGSKHFGLLGVNYWDFQGYFIEFGYRYTAKKGFLLKATFQFMPEEEGFPSIGLGYSF
jgi:hypothetical protein